MSRAGGMLAVASLALVVGGCGLPGAEPAGMAVLPDRTMADNAIAPILLVAQGLSPTGMAYRAWIYRTQDGMYCFEVAQGSGSGSSCGSEVGGVIGLGSGAGDPAQGTMATGGTATPGVARAVATLADGTQVALQLVRPGAFLGPDVRVFVLALPPGATVRRVDYFDAGGTIVETAEVP